MFYVRPSVRISMILSVCRSELFPAHCVNACRKIEGSPARFIPIAMSSVLALSFVPAQLTQLVQILSNKTLPAFAKTFTPKSCSATLKMIGMKNNFTSVILDGTHLRITFQLRSKLAYLISIEYSWHHSNIAKLVPICQHPSNNASWHYATTKIC